MGRSQSIDPEARFSITVLVILACIWVLTNALFSERSEHKSRRNVSAGAG
jgi:hypothetical protein